MAIEKRVFNLGKRERCYFGDKNLIKEENRINV